VHFRGRLGSREVEKVKSSDVGDLPALQHRFATPSSIPAATNLLDLQFTQSNVSEGHLVTRQCRLTALLHTESLGTVRRTGVGMGRGSEDISKSKTIFFYSFILLKRHEYLTKTNSSNQKESKVIETRTPHRLHHRPSLWTDRRTSTHHAIPSHPHQSNSRQNLSSCISKGVGLFLSLLVVLAKP
jgi:hypothetical protein